MGEQKKNVNARRLGAFRKNHHQWLAQFGRERLNQQLWQVIGVMKACRTMDDFRGKFAHIFKNVPLQLSFLDG